MKTYNLKPHYSFEDAKKKAGEWVTEKDYDLLINDDCNAYNEKGEPLFFFRKNKIPSELCANAYQSLRKAAMPSNNRGAAAGLIDEENHLATRTTKIKKDGTLSKTNTSKEVNSGIVGFFDRNARFPYCRQTAWLEKNFSQFKKAYPYIKHIDKLFAEASPEKYLAQKSMIDKTQKDFVIEDTAFTTITVNKNFRTALHTDAGDYAGGLGNLAVLQAGKYEGGYTAIPRYRVAFDVRSGDVCFFNVHEYHGNTEIKSKLAYERISIVCYYRENMFNCLNAEDELKRAQNRIKGEKLN